ncbi:hypothetical protein GCM10029964_077320 [Kibdelosporangium lantanae]
MKQAPPGSPPTDADLRYEVELTRQELSRTVEDLAAKLDVKAQAARRRDELVHFVRTNPEKVAAGVAAAVVFIIVIARTTRPRYS